MLEKILTQDGSYSLYDSDLKETFHSRKGALTESIHVYISEGLDFFLKNKLNIISLEVFEMGFGTGLNAVLSKRFAELKKIKINYTCIDKYPLSDIIIKSVKVNDLSNNEIDILNCNWDETNHISDLFKIHKIYDDFSNINYKNYFDIIF